MEKITKLIKTWNLFNFLCILDAQKSNEKKYAEIGNLNKKMVLQNVTFHHPLPRREDLMLV